MLAEGKCIKLVLADCMQRIRKQLCAEGKVDADNKPASSEFKEKNVLHRWAS